MAVANAVIHWSTLLESWVAAKRAKAECSKSVLQQAIEIFRLRRRGLSASDYYFHRLFDDRRFTWKQKTQYTSWRFQKRAFPFVNDPALVCRSGISGTWCGLIDKVLYHLIMTAAGIPVPPVLAIYDRERPHAGPIPVLGGAEEVRRFLKSQEGKALFLKPAQESTGRGVLCIEKVEEGRMHLGDATILDEAGLLAHLERYRRCLFQERLLPHPSLRRITGATVPTVRAITLVEGDSTEIHRAVFRIPIAKNMIDNFGGGKTGNLVASVDPASGVLQRVVQGVGFDWREVTHHPETGERLEGLALPDWKESLDLIQRASRVLLGMAMQAWDVAFTDRGPLMIEVNDESSVDVLQIAGPPGLLDERLVRFLRARGFRWHYPPG